MSAIDQKFAALRAAGKKAFIPFITAGDPSLEMTARVLQTLSDCGAAIGEVGIPYSDPIADGPLIQASYTRALQAGCKLADIFTSVGAVAPQLSMPLVSMVSYSIVLRTGAELYIAAAQAAGFSGAIVPDLLLEEAADFRELCRERDFSLIHLVTPTTPAERMLRIAESSTGFLYFVSITGITGERNELAPGLIEKVAWLRERTELPVCIGFGISQVEHVRQLSPIADGLIVGSALVRRLTEDLPEEQRLENVQAIANQLIQAMG